MGYAIGIDIGTANTRVAVCRDGEYEVIPDKNGQRSMPSYVAFTERCRLFGSAAKAHAASNPKNTVYGVKRVLGQRMSKTRLDRYTRISPNDVSVQNGGPNKMTISVSYKNRPHRVLPVQVFGMLLAQARVNAEAYLGESIEGAVISVPAHFDQLHRREVYDAASLAGITVMRIHTSIESIAIYYTVTTRTKDNRICVFLDCGAGFFNAGVADIDDDAIEILSGVSDKNLGGEDMIDRVYNHFADDIRRKRGWDINMDIRARRRLRVACEAAMRELSSTASTRVHIDSLYRGEDFSGRLSREKLEQLCQDLLHATIITLDKIFHKSDKLFPYQVQNKSSVTEIVIAGGCSRIPKLQELWSAYFDSKPLVKMSNPEEGEVLGSAIYAARLNRSGQSGSLLSSILLMAIVPFNIGLRTTEGLMRVMIPHKETIPTKRIKDLRLCDLELEPGEPPVLQLFQGNWSRVMSNVIIGALDISRILPESDDGHSETMIQITVDIDTEHFVTASAIVDGKSTSPSAWQTATTRTGKELESLIAQAEAYKEDDTREEALVAERCSLDLRLASLCEIQPPPFRTKRMVSLLESLVLWRNKLDELGSGNFADYREFDIAIDTVARELKTEELRGTEITGLRSHADRLRTKLLATTQTPKTVTLLQSVDNVTQWVDQNEEAEIQEYQAKLRSLMAISVELISLSEAPPSRESTPNIGTPQRPGPGLQTQTSGPRGLDELFPETGWDTNSKYTDAEFENIASYLRNTDRVSWCKVPRIYTVLRLIGREELVDTFIKHEMTDIWFPFSDNTLPKTLKQPHRAQFLHTQEAVFSKALELERGTGLDGKRHRKHAHFSHGEPLPFKVMSNLGSGAHGFVDKVVSTLSYKEYARKRFKRSAINKKDVKSFLNEVKILKALSNRHCIDMVGSYSDPRYFALITHPVAEYNLESYYSLALADRDKSSILQGFFGCLAGTLDYLHSQKVVHQDIKPQNILVKDNSHVLVTDFGIARSWEGLTRATTTATVDRTWLYAAPEVVRGGPKNETADVWSLGCVFLEMCSVLKGQPPAEMRAFFKARSDSTSFHDNAAPGHIAAWVESLRERSPTELNGALEWVGRMLEVEPAHRCRPFELFDSIVAASDGTGVLFCGACCRDRGGSALDSNDEQLDPWSEGDDDDM